VAAAMRRRVAKTIRCSPPAFAFRALGELGLKPAVKASLRRPDWREKRCATDPSSWRQPGFRRWSLVVISIQRKTGGVDCGLIQGIETAETSFGCRGWQRGDRSPFRQSAPMSMLPFIAWATIAAFAGGLGLPSS